MKVLIAGDFCPQNRVEEKLNEREYEELFSQVRDITTVSDYSIVNLECPIVSKDNAPIVKCEPLLKGSEHTLDAIVYMGFKCVTLANNHFRDYGDEAIDYTLSALKRLQVDSVGGGMNLKEASQVLYKKLGDDTLAVINCCEHEFSIADEEHAGSNPLNPISLYYVIKEARRSADYMICETHSDCVREYFRSVIQKFSKQ